MRLSNGDTLLSFQDFLGIRDELTEIADLDRLYAADVLTKASWLRVRRRITDK